MEPVVKRALFLVAQALAVALLGALATALGDAALFDGQLVVHPAAALVRSVL